MLLNHNSRNIQSNYWKIQKLESNGCLSLRLIFSKEIKMEYFIVKNIVIESSLLNQGNLQTILTLISWKKLVYKSVLVDMEQL